MDISVRNAAAQDYEVYCRLHLEVQALHVEHEPHIFRMPPRGLIFTHEQYLGFLEGENQVVFLAQEGEEPVGFAYVILREAPPLPIYVPRCSALVEAVGVTAAYRGRGIGMLLMQQAEVWGKQRGATSLELSVHTFNHNAIAFYESLGLKAYTQRMEKRLV